MFKKGLLPMLLLSTTLAGCQMFNETDTDKNEEPDTEETEPNDESNKSDETSDKDTDDTETDESEEDTDQENSNDTEDVSKENYSDKDEAADAIEDYEELDETNIDLGHGVNGFVEGAAGHQYISWNEGRWYIQIDFPSDPENAIDTYEDGEDMAKAIVDYLEDNKLPAPDRHGVIKISGSRDHPETNIRWQEDNIVYEIDQEVEDPIDALQIAVDYENN